MSDHPTTRRNGENVSNHVHQATGMVSVQAHCDMTEAFNRLKIRAAATGQSMEHMALNVLDHLVRFDA
jgi:AmiR/NasT family two-component response regulator